MKLTVNYGGDAVSLPLAVLNADADPVSVRLLILLCSDKKYRDIDDNIAEICDILHCDESQVRESVGFWRGCGILTSEGRGRKNAAKSTSSATSESQKKTENVSSPVQPKVRPAGESPDYSGKALSELLENESNGLKGLIRECENVLGKVFSPTEVGRIAGLTDYLGLENEHVLLMFKHYKRVFDDQGKRVSVPYIEKTAYALWEDGIDSTEKFEDYMRRSEERSSLISRLRRLFGFGDRTLTKKENTMIDLWTDELGMSYEMIVCAYNVNIDNTKQLSLAYISKVLTNWHNTGITTPEQVEAAENQHKADTEAEKASKSSFDTDDFFEKALQRSYDEMKKAQ